MFRGSIPVVMYHHVSPLHRELNVTPEIFEDQLRSLKNRGWKTLSGTEFLDYIVTGEIPSKSVLLTFDDGFADNYIFAYPILRKFGMKAMLFVATSLIGDVDINRYGFIARPHNEAWELAFTDRNSEVMCTWKEIMEMESSGVIDIQSHGSTHMIPDYIGAGQYERIRDDLESSRALLENRLVKTVLHLAWPKGGYNQRTIEIAKDLGYKALYTTDRGANSDENLSAIKRLPVKMKGGKWLAGKLNIYSSVFLSRFYLALRTGI